MMLDRILEIGGITIFLMVILEASRYIVSAQLSRIQKRITQKLAKYRADSRKSLSDVTEIVQTLKKVEKMYKVFNLLCPIQQQFQQCETTKSELAILSTQINQKIDKISISLTELQKQILFQNSHAISNNSQKDILHLSEQYYQIYGDLDYSIRKLSKNKDDNMLITLYNTFRIKQLQSIIDQILTQKIARTLDEIIRKYKDSQFCSFLESIYKKQTIEAGGIQKMREIYYLFSRSMSSSVQYEQLSPIYRKFIKEINELLVSKSNLEQQMLISPAVMLQATKDLEQYHLQINEHSINLSPVLNPPKQQNNKVVYQKFISELDTMLYRGFLARQEQMQERQQSKQNFSEKSDKIEQNIEVAECSMSKKQQNSSQTDNKPKGNLIYQLQIEDNTDQ